MRVSEVVLDIQVWQKLIRGSCCIHSISLSLSLSLSVGAMASVLWQAVMRYLVMRTASCSALREQPKLAGRRETAGQLRAKIANWQLSQVKSSANSFPTMQKCACTHQTLSQVVTVAPDANYAHVILASLLETAIKKKKEWGRELVKIREKSM